MNVVVFSNPCARSPKAAGRGSPCASLLRRLGSTFLLSDKHVGDDAHVRLPEMAPSDGAVGESHGAVSMYVRPPLTVHRNATHERNDFRLLIQLDLLLAQPTLHVSPAEEALIDGPERREMAVLDVVLFSKVGQTGHDFVALD